MTDTTSTATVIQLSRPEVYVNNIAWGGSDAVAAALSTNFIHIVDLEAKKSKQTIDVPQNVVNIHFDLRGTPVLRAVDDSFGIHLYDIRSGSKKKSRLNPMVESHSVVSSAISDNYIVLASSTFLDVEEIKKKKKNKKKGKGKKRSKKGEEEEEEEPEEEPSSSDEDSPDESDAVAFPHIISVFDIRGRMDPMLTIKESHSGSVTSMSFMKDGRHLLTGGGDGLVNVFDVSLSKEDDAIQSTVPIDSSVSRVGWMSKRLCYGVTDDNKCVVMSPNSPDDIDILFKKQARDDYFLVDMLKGGEEEKPVAMLECDAEGKLYLVSCSVDGKKSEVVETWGGHTDIIRSTAYNRGVLVTGGEDGKIVVKPIDLRPKGGTVEKVKKNKDKKSSKPY